MSKETFPLEQMQQQMIVVLKRAPVLLGNEALNFFLDRFKDQAWLGSSKEKWAPRKKVSKWGKKTARNNRNILIDSGRLRRSVRIIRTGALDVTLGSDVPYARAHNEGLRLGVIQSVRSFNRRTKTGKRVTVKAHTRRINQRLPKRQFMGNSPYLTQKLTRTLAADIIKHANPNS